MSPRLHHRGCRAARPRGHDTRNLADSRPRRGQRHTNGGDRLAGGPVAAGEARVVARLLVSDGGEGSAADSTWWPAKASGRPALSRNTIASSRSGPLVPATGTRLGSAPSPETIATRSATAATATIAATVALCRVTASFARSPELLVRSIACAWTCVRCPRPGYWDSRDSVRTITGAHGGQQPTPIRHDCDAAGAVDGDQHPPTSDSHVVRSRTHPRPAARTAGGGIDANQSCRSVVRCPQAAKAESEMVGFGPPARGRKPSAGTR